MATVRSKDGTEIAFETFGEGTPLIIIDGATAYPAVNPGDAEMGKLLADRFKTYTYDRRGRGASGDTDPYAIEREIEDVAALIEHAGEPAVVFGYSSGGVLTLDIAASGLPVRAAAVFEPPFIVDDSRPPLPSDYVEQLDAHVAAGRRSDAFELFMTAAAGMPPEFVESMRGTEIWTTTEKVAHTIAYDGRIMGTTMSGHPLPADRWAAIDVPVLVMYGEGTMPFIITGDKALAELLPTATLKPVPGENHGADPAVLAAALREFVS